MLTSQGAPSNPFFFVHHDTLASAVISLTTPYIPRAHIVSTSKEDRSIHNYKLSSSLKMDTIDHLFNARVRFATRTNPAPVIIVLCTPQTTPVASPTTEKRKLIKGRLSDLTAGLTAHMNNDPTEGAVKSRS